MDCLQCGAKMGKSDIYCIECNAPVLTEDDVTTMLSTDQSKYIDIVTNTGAETISDTMPYIEPYSEQEASPLPEDSGAFAPADDALLYDELNDDILNGLDQPNDEDLIALAEQGNKPESITQIYEKPSSKTKALERLKNITLRGFHRRVFTSHDDELSEPVPVKSNRAVVIAVTIVVCFALIGVGMYILIRPPREQQEQDEAEQVPVIAEIEDSVDQNVPVAAEPIPAPPVVDDIIIFNGDHIQSAFHTMIEGTVLLRAQIVPETVDAVIFWLSSDTEVLEVMPLNNSGTEAHIIGKAAGIVDIIVSAGEFEIVFPVTVDDYPMHLQLEEAITDSTMPIWIDILWADGRENLMERDPETGLWYWVEGTDKVEVHPNFGNDTVALTFSFTEDSAEINYLFADGSGYRKRQDREWVTDDSRFTWEFSTSQIEPAG